MTHIAKAWTPRDLKADLDGGAVEAVFSVFGNVDSHGELIVPGALDDMHGVEVPMSAYGHASWKGALPIGKGVIHVEHDRARFRGEFFNTLAARETREVLKGLGPLGEWSFGLDIRDDEITELDGRYVRLLKRVHVMEVSPVLIGANRLTHTVEVRSRPLTPDQRAVLAAAARHARDHEEGERDRIRAIRRNLEAVA